MEKEVKVSKITENYISHYVYMTKELYDSLYEENLSYNMILIKTQDGKSDETLAKNILESDMASKVGLTSTVADMLDETMDNFDYVVIVLIVSAGLLAFVLLYNLSNVNISERIRELATIKVLGFYDKEVYTYVTRETILLTIIGIAFGLIAGYFLNYFIIGTCEIDILRFSKIVHPISYLYAILITVLFTIIVNIFTYFALKKINMIESLKSIE